MMIHPSSTGSDTFVEMSQKMMIHPAPQERHFVVEKDISKMCPRWLFEYRVITLELQKNFRPRLA